MGELLPRGQAPQDDEVLRGVGAEAERRRQRSGSRLLLGLCDETPESLLVLSRSGRQEEE